ncbi:hypothetical protein OOU_Y34scaffold00071g42 [Pyricularia oryzae Y34]|uniref:Uncharacterized protein n=1 Tax=Pyricularia oryzae (strain Y34) TaxID=1143189 RepID=A0AA97PRP4_PYRO3|nr:hypothetical protein OOU_Y34scaffold00071g42 [Pyricularia oryzae Y34]
MDLSRLAVANKSCASHWLPGRSSLGTTVKQGPGQSADNSHLVARLCFRMRFLHNGKFAETA